MSVYLREHLSYDQAKMVVESAEDGKSLYMVGKFLGGAQVNENGRVYPAHEIRKAVDDLNETVTGGYSVLGEVDHPEGLNINLDRVSHLITKMWMDGPDGYGKLKIIPTPMGQLVRTMLESGVKLGVSSRGSGNVSESTGHVSDYKIVTVDIVAQPSAPGAYPKAVYESLLNMKHGHKALVIAEDVARDKRAQKFLQDEVIRLIKDLKIQEKK
ncbi:prohead core scaffolding protein and protease [uncultured Caudovirales phage]|uniref:Prohead core scaffolding protein and protease n=1 Tax=uncultured Caudovirales phage TaxID=2100421 RepID=A0A6J5LAR1_9CAUD|nr:prohead core scaffolding protein and protease [uncultured Caudovirales phage]